MIVYQTLTFRSEILRFINERFQAKTQGVQLFEL